MDQDYIWVRVDSNDLYRDENGHYVVKTSYKCFLCEEVFMYTEDLRRHLNDHKGGRGGLIGTKVYTNMEEQTNFEQSIQTEEHIDMEQSIMHIEGPINTEKPMHIEEATNFEPHIYIEENINSEEPAKTQTKQPKDQCKETTYLCEYCQKVFNFRQSFTAHVRNTHSDRNYFCRLCGIIYEDKAKMAYHNRECHSNKTPYVFPQVSQPRKKKSDLPRYVCLHCNGKFLFQLQLLYHIRHYVRDMTKFVEKPSKVIYL